MGKKAITFSLKIIAYAEQSDKVSVKIELTACNKEQASLTEKVSHTTYAKDADLFGWSFAVESQLHLFC